MSYWGPHDWKDGFNNSAMDRMELRLRSGMMQRKGEGRYDMRKIEGKYVHTNAARGGRYGYTWEHVPVGTWNVTG